jgi:phenylalanyl-tRNA synthetase beta chain
LQEVITYRLTAKESEARLIPPGSGVPADDRPYVSLTNPISVDKAVMRHSVLSSVLEIAAGNSRHQERIAIFEIGEIYLAREDGLLPDEKQRLSIIMAGVRNEAHWREPAKKKLLDFFDLKGVIEGLFAGLHLDVRYEAAKHPTFRPGRTARIWLGETQLGMLGDLHPLVVESYGGRFNAGQPVLAADLDLSAILEKMGASYSFDSISSYPAVREDLALVVDRHIPAADVAEALRQAGGFLLKKVELFDVYEGSQIPYGKKSLAYHLTFQAPDKTLTDKDAFKQRQRILNQLGKRMGAQLRE